MEYFDQHVHSYYSYDSDQPIKEYLDKTRELGLSYFVLTDHYDFNYQDTGKDNDFDIDKRKKELDELQKDYCDIKILNGIEIGYKKKEVDRIKKIINTHDFDIVNLSVHDLGIIDYYFPEYYQRFGIKKVLTDYYLTQLDMVRNFDDYDVLCHIDFAFKTAYLIDNSISIKEYEDYIIEIMKEIIKKDKTFELNVKVQSFLPVEHTKYLLKLYKDLGGKNVTLSSDAHKVNRLNDQFDKYIVLIKEAGFDHLNYFIKRNRYSISI